MPAVEVPIVPETLAWALRRARLDDGRLARAVDTTPDKVRAWCDGRARPTYEQTKRIARKLNLSFGQLLLPPPDIPTLPIKDFRRGHAAPDEHSPELVETVYDALRKRDWWLEYNGEKPLPFLLPSQDPRKAKPEDVATDIREHIPVQHFWGKVRSREDLLRELSDAAESVGILVLRRSIVGSNTHRPLDPGEFSGFAIADPAAPIIVINTKDYVARQNFTFAHELAHIWLGQSALDDNLELETLNQQEEFCDRVAAEFLLPTREFLDVWQGDPLEAADKAARRFKVSRWAALRRAHELELIPFQEYRRLLDDYYRDFSTQPKRTGGFADFVRSVETRNSPRFTNAVVEATLGSDLTPKEGASLLGLSLRAFLSYLERKSQE